MKNKLIFVTGLPGSGKSYLIHNDAKLSRLPHVDIMDIYSKYPETTVFGGWEIAQDKMIAFALDLMNNGNTDVTCEAILLPGTPSRARLERVLKENKISHCFINVDASYETCMSRVNVDYKIAHSTKDDGRLTYCQKRIDILNSYRSKGLIK